MYVYIYIYIYSKIRNIYLKALIRFHAILWSRIRKHVPRERIETCG